MKYSRIAGTGSYLPPNVVSNDDLAKKVDTSNQWIIERTGIERRHIALPEQTSSVLAEKAAQQALDRAGISAKELGLIIVATTTPDQVMPSTACILQAKLNAPGIPAFDISVACAGYIYAMSIADQFIRTGFIQYALIVGTETMSRVIDWSDRKTCILFGDGAGATVLQAADQPGILSTHIHADGNYKDHLYIPSAFPTADGKRADLHVKMSGPEVFKFAVHKLGSIVDESLSANNLDKSDIDWLVPHQANIRIIQATAKKLNLPMERVIVTVADQANTSSASIPLALDQAISDGRIQPGQTLLLEAIGAGFAWGSALIKM